MWRYLAGGTAVIALIIAGFLVFSGNARPRPLLPAQPVSQSGEAPVASDPLPDAVPQATDKTREQKRFDRYDKDRDAKITREEYLVQRRKAYARLDVDGDGKLEVVAVTREGYMWVWDTPTKAPAFVEWESFRNGPQNRGRYVSAAPAEHDMD